MLRRMHTPHSLHGHPKLAGSGSPSRRSMRSWLWLGAIAILSACVPADAGDAAGNADRQDTVASSTAQAASVTAEAGEVDPSAQQDDGASDDALQTLSTTDPADPTLAAPSGCWAERSCGARKYVCKRPDSPRPCGAAGCTEMQFACSSDAGCLEGYRCVLCKPGDPFPCTFATGLCKPTGCRTDRDCGSTNLVCQSGACAHKTCRNSRSCRGYCVAGSCWNKAGWCHDTTLPPPP